MSRVRSGSRNKQLSKASKAPPTKEDILNTLDQFGDQENGDPKSDSAQEDNNNLTRGKSGEDSDLDGWEVTDIEQPISASFSHSYSAEWEKLFSKTNYKKLLKAYATRGNLRGSRFRSICWKVFLEVLPEDIEKWVTKSRELRSKYDQLKNNLIVNPRKAVDMSVDLMVNNPLSQADESPWNRFFQDNELRLTIKQDVIRTFPELEFFKSEEVRQQMLDILFCFCKTHVYLSYKQGMHELLAPLIFILHCDHQAFLHANEVESLTDIIKEIMDPHYLEHDAYAMLCQIMETVEPWYLTKEAAIPKGKEKYKNAMPFARIQDMNPSNAIVSKLTRVQDYILKKYDIELYNHLERLEITPQIYGIRWVRLLFGREFPMQDLLAMWDAIFADGIGFDLVDYIFVAMLLYIRDLLLASDYPQCLNCLMRYPPVGDVHFLIEKALYLREPNHHPRPPNYTFQTVNKAAPTKDRPSKAVEYGNKFSTNFVTLTKKMHGGRPRTLHMPKDQSTLSKSTSVPGNLQTDFSPASPKYPRTKRGSSASLSQVEDTMFHTAPSNESLARLETGSQHSMNSSYSAYSPDDGSLNGSVSRFSTMPRTAKKGKITAQQAKEFENMIGSLQSNLSDKDSMCQYCAKKLDIHIELLQKELLPQSIQNEDEILLAIAGIKQVRDVLKGTLKFSENLIAEDPIMKDHFNQEGANSSPESDNSGTQPEKMTMVSNTTSDRAKLFYMSSEENSEAAESPTDGTHPSKYQNKDLELSDYKLTHGGTLHFGGSNSAKSGGSCITDYKSYTGNVGHRKNSNQKNSGPSPNPLYHDGSSDSSSEEDYT